MIVSCQTWGWEWGTDEMVEAMKELKQLGVNWVAIHPYARIHSSGTVNGFRSRRLQSENFTWLTRPIKEAHRLGLKICIKPHLAYWGTKFRWRGDIKFDSERQWENFFHSYEQWVSSIATTCKEADAIVIGTELDKTISHEKEWRRIIQTLRTITDAPLTYGANWTDYQNVPFWDALDVIGIQAYFPLTDSPGLPDRAKLEQSWERHLKDLDAFAEKWGKSIVFTELGYDVSINAARKPWESGRWSREAEEIQRICLESSLKAIEKDEHVIGAFLWKWFAGDTRGENFLKSTPQMREVIKHYWAYSNNDL
jgi:sugar phosphate isomerase/epimerase